MIHGKKDKLIPSEHSVNLLKNCRASRKKLVCPGEMEHNSNLFAHADYLAIPCINFFGLPGYCSESAPEVRKEFLLEQMYKRHRFVRDSDFGWFCSGCASVKSLEGSEYASGAFMRDSEGTSDMYATEFRG